MSHFGVSVVIPLHNKERFIRRTLESALAQIHAAGEIIIIDDASTDDSVRAIHDLIGDKVRLIIQPNAGPGPARNRGIAEAKSPWIAFLDGDDLWRPDHLATLAALARNFPAADLLASGYEVARSEDCNESPRSTDGEIHGDLLDYFDEPTERSTIWTSCVAVRRSVLRDAGGFGAFCPGEDRDLWTRLALDHAFAASPKRTAIYVQHTGGVMERLDRQPLGFVMPPAYAVIARALRDPHYTARHAAIARHFRRLLTLNVRQALYRGEGAAARAYIRELEKSGRARLGMLRLLSWLPAPLLRAGLAARSSLRG